MLFKRIRRVVSMALLALVLVAAPALAQDEFFAGKRVWVQFDGRLVPTGKLVSKNADGSFKVAVYASQPNTDPRVTQPEEALLRGDPVATIDVPASEIESWNATRFTAWVMRNGEPWPKAQVVADDGTSVTVKIFDANDQLEATKTIKDAKKLKEFRALNRATQPNRDVTSEIDDATTQAIAAINAELAKNGNKLPDGEAYPKMLTLPELTEAVRGIAQRWAPGIAAESDRSKRAELQDQMMREIYVEFERVSPIKHSERDTTTDDWRAAGERFAAMLPEEANELQRELVQRVSDCYGKCEIVWKVMNLAEVPKIAGVGFRLIDGEIHGILQATYADLSRRMWETTEGFEAHATRAFKRFEVMFHGPGPGGHGLDYMEQVKPMPGKGADVISNELLDRIHARDAKVAGADKPEVGAAELLERAHDAERPEGER